MIVDTFDRTGQLHICQFQNSMHVAKTYPNAKASNGYGKGQRSTKKLGI